MSSCRYFVNPRRNELICLAGCMIHDCEFNFVMVFDKKHCKLPTSKVNLYIILHQSFFKQYVNGYKRSNSGHLICRPSDHQCVLNGCFILFIETWHARRVGEQTIEMLAFFSNIAGGVFCVLTAYTWQTKHMFVFITMAATLLLLSGNHW